MFETVAETLRKSIVRVQSGRRGSGSGVVWRSDGVIISNAHVVRREEATIQLADGRVFPAVVTARNLQRDLVALKIDAMDLPAITVGNSNAVRTGELVFAAGYPGGTIPAVTTGMIHSINPKNAWIQADIRLAPGNSGGALVNAAGHVIGINTMIANGIGFAIPSQIVEQFLTAPIERPYLGVTLQPVRVAIDSPAGERRNIRRPVFGLLITAIESGSPAESAQLLPGDVLIGSRGALFQTPDELFRILENSNIGDGLLIDLLRGGNRITQSIVLNHGNSAQAA